MNKEQCLDHLAKLQFIAASFSMLNAVSVDDINNEDLNRFSCGLIRFTNNMISELTDCIDAVKH